MNSQWLAEWDDREEAWQPRLIAQGVAPSLDIWFATEQACDEWISREIIAPEKAEGWDEGFAAADSNTPRSRKGHWENAKSIKGMRTWIPDPEPTNPYRNEPGGA